MTAQLDGMGNMQHADERAKLGQKNTVDYKQANKVSRVETMTSNSESLSTNSNVFEQNTTRGSKSCISKENCADKTHNVTQEAKFKARKAHKAVIPWASPNMSPFHQQTVDLLTSHQFTPFYLSSSQLNQSQPNSPTMNPN